MIQCRRKSRRKCRRPRKISRGSGTPAFQPWANRKRSARKARSLHSELCTDFLDDLHVIRQVFAQKIKAIEKEDADSRASLDVIPSLFYPPILLLLAELPKRIRAPDGYCMKTEDGGGEAAHCGLDHPKVPYHSCVTCAGQLEPWVDRNHSLRMPLSSRTTPHSCAHAFAKGFLASGCQWHGHSSPSSPLCRAKAESLSLRHSDSECHLYDGADKFAPVSVCLQTVCS